MLKSLPLHLLAACNMPTPFIALEEHYYSEVAYASLDDGAKALLAPQPGIVGRLKGLGTERLADMNNGSIAIQVISHGALTDPSPEVCRAGNDDLAAGIVAYGQNASRFAGFSVLPMGYPAEAAAELERSVKKYGFVGALVGNTCNGTFYDGPEYDVLWAKFVELDVPFYLHPGWPTAEVQRLLADGHYSIMARNLLSESMWDWHVQVGLHILRLQNARVFDRFPKLKVIIGHFGELLPGMIERVASQELLITQDAPKRRFKEVWANNIWITTSAIWSIDPLATILRNTAIDHILYSVDWPFNTYEGGKSFMKDLKTSGWVTEEEWEMIGWKNAAKLLKLTNKA